MRLEKIYRVKVLDLKYLADYEHLNFNYFIYEIKADCEEEAIKTVGIKTSII